MCLMKCAHKRSDLRPQDTLERLFVRGNDVYGNAALAQRSSNFETDEACADNRLPGARSLPDKNPGVGETAEVVKLRVRSAGDGYLNGLGSRRQ